MLRSVTKPNGKTVSFEYDALGRRTAKTNTSPRGGGREGAITRFVWDGNVPLHEWKYSLKGRPEWVVDELGMLYHKDFGASPKIFMCAIKPCSVLITPIMPPSGSTFRIVLI